MLFDKVASKLQHPGAVAVLPLDTVYSLVARTADPQAVARLYALKSREHKPGTLIAADIDQLEQLGIKRRYLQAVAGYWPNPISIVLPCADELEYLHQGMQSLAVRVPADETLRQLLQQTGPLITSSANQPSELPATTVAEAKKCFGSHVDVYIDGGDLRGRKSSTVIRIIDDAVEVIRAGAVDIDPTTGAIRT